MEMNESERGRRKVKKGIVVSNKMEKTVVVKIQRKIHHPEYDKVVKQEKKVYAHNDLRPLKVGEEVTIIETRPLSKLKRWRVVA